MVAHSAAGVARGSWLWSSTVGALYVLYGGRIDIPFILGSVDVYISVYSTEALCCHDL